MMRTHEPSLRPTVQPCANGRVGAILSVVLAVLALVAATDVRADSAICNNVFVGDLNNDKKVTVADITVFQQLRATNSYSPCADFTRDGILNDADGTVLATLVNFATSPTNGGGQFRVPNISLNELRLGVPSLLTPLQQPWEQMVDSI
jgi:hypothetical protein